MKLWKIRHRLSRILRLHCFVEAKTADLDLTSIKWFDGITEIVPCDERELSDVIDLASSYEIIDPVNAAVLLNHINERFDLGCETAGLSVCDIFYWDGDKFVKLTNLIRQLCALHNAINTVCENYTGSQKTAIVSFT